MNKINILLVDDHPMVIQGLRAIINNLSNMQVAATANNAFEAMERLAVALVDIAILDINLPDINGIELCRKIKSVYPSVQVLAMSTFRERNYVAQMIQNGAMGYLIKSASAEEISDAIEAVHQNKMYLSHDIGNLSLQKEKPSKPMPVLTRREKEILGLISEGLTNNQIASQLFISELTVDTHRRNLLMKFEANNTASLIKLAVKYDLV